MQVGSVNGERIMILCPPGGPTAADTDVSYNLKEHSSLVSQRWTIMPQQWYNYNLERSKHTQLAIKKAVTVQRRRLRASEPPGPTLTGASGSARGLLRGRHRLRVLHVRPVHISGRFKLYTRSQPCGATAETMTPSHQCTTGQTACQCQRAPSEPCRPCEPKRCRAHRGCTQEEGARQAELLLLLLLLLGPLCCLLRQQGRQCSSKGPGLREAWATTHDRQAPTKS